MLLQKKRKSYKTKHIRMPLCNKDDIQLVLDAINFELKNKEKQEALKFIDKFGSKELCSILHAMRRWYTGWSHSNARKLKSHYKELKSIIDTSLPIGTYRGFKVFRNPKHQDFSRDTKDLQNVKEGDILKLKVIRNGGASSFTNDLKIAERFAKPDNEKFGIIVKLLNAQNAKVIIAPKFKTKKWFNELYELTMGKSHRIIEVEWLIYSPVIKVQVVKIKK